MKTHRDSNNREAAPPHPAAPAARFAPDAPARPRFGEGVRVFAERYDLFLVDQWGVLHDGRTAYPGAAECLRRLRALGKRVVILSNSGKRSAANAVRLEAMDIAGDCYTALITSGEIAWESLAARSYPFLPALGRRCLLLSAEDEGPHPQGLDIEWVPTVAAADFLFLAGVGDDRPMAFYESILEQAGARRLPLVCANPDLVRLSSAGLVFGAGELARRYERMGGQVHSIGKPYRSIYEYCLKVLPGFAASRTIAVGDSFFHDVAGGAGFGLATAFVTDGIHQTDFPDTLDEAGRFRKLAELAADHGVWPDWIVRRFRW
jgi:HAD superfamily hydrolase (TIGR01459 family)